MPQPRRLVLLPLLLAAAATARAETIGEVDTVFKLIGPDHKIVVEAYDDPKVQGVTCYVSRAKTGGIKGALGVAEDKSDASIACRQVAPIAFTTGKPLVKQEEMFSERISLVFKRLRVVQPLVKQEEMFSERISLVFKRLRVVRMVDPKRNALVYLTYSERLIEGSPQNSVTVVPVDAATRIPLK